MENKIKESIKHIISHILMFALPFFILPFLYRTSQRTFDEWYLSPSTRVLATLTGYVLLMIPIVLVLRRNTAGWYAYYSIVAFIINGFVAIGWWLGID